MEYLPTGYNSANCKLSFCPQTCVFSLAATVWSAADWRLTEAEKPSLSLRFQELLVSMTDDDPDARPSLHNVLQVSNEITYLAEFGTCQGFSSMFGRNKN